MCIALRVLCGRLKAVRETTQPQPCAVGVLFGDGTHRAIKKKMRMREICDDYALWFCNTTKKEGMRMGDDVGQVLLPTLREMVTTLVEACEDASLLDLIHKLLLNV